MIGVRLRGRLGNVLFELCYAEKIAENLDTSVYIMDIPDNEEKKSDYYYYHNELYGREFFRRYDVVHPDTDIRSTYIRDREKALCAKPDAVFDFYIAGVKYVYPEIRDIFTPSKELKEELMDLYGPTGNSLCIHVRRGDFLNPEIIAGGWHSCPKEYWEAAYDLTDKDYDKVIIISDDMEWCKNNIDLGDNTVFADKSTENPGLFCDLFLQSMCRDNIISASTYSWWGMYLNGNPGKKVIMPYPWNTIPGHRKNTYYYTEDCIKLGIYDYKIK